ncbi:flagellar assembly factor FliW [Microbacterium testaceum]|uniref:flagellar assembly protein FliW n=1 Tax=Microbacterium TaxID=33882 RepID=UPI001AE8E957|nr:MULTISPECIES: flagellar assembly protein FliW [Microbacterium]MDQ1113093.1 flagellar assembly factor FliW [Microbacterium testaceum]MDR6099810.1 flagellar assembly factor FliW [Microbacterium sp. SORGH_AS_0454]
MTTALPLSSVDVEFAKSLPGLAPRTSFLLEPIEGAEGLYALRSTIDDVRLFLLDPASGGLAYDPPLAAAALVDIGAAADEVRMFVVANPGEDGVFVNLRAPILVNARTGAAAQVIFDDTVYPIRARLTA